MTIFEVKVFDHKNNSSLVGVLKRHNNGQRPKTHRHNSLAVTIALTVSRIFIEKVLMWRTSASDCKVGVESLAECLGYPLALLQRILKVGEWGGYLFSKKQLNSKCSMPYCFCTVYIVSSWQWGRSSLLLLLLQTTFTLSHTSRKFMIMQLMIDSK